MNNLKLTPRAAREFADAVDYLVAHSPAAAHQFADTIELAFENILTYPEIGNPTTARSGNYRQYTLTSFPYKIFYRVEGELILVASIFHTSQDPDKI